MKIKYHVRYAVGFIRGNLGKFALIFAGIVFSSAVLTLLSSLYFSYHGASWAGIRSQNGIWHYGYSHVSADTCPLPVSDSSLAISVISESGYAEVGDSYLGVLSYNETAMTNMPPTLLSGRLPASETEIALPADYMEPCGISLGDTVTLHLGTRFSSDGKKADFYSSPTVGETLSDRHSVSYTVVGVVADIRLPKSTVMKASPCGLFAVTVTGENCRGEICHAFVYDQKMKDNIGSLRKTLQEAVNMDSGITGFAVNGKLLMYQGLKSDMVFDLIEGNVIEKTEPSSFSDNEGRIMKIIFLASVLLICLFSLCLTACIYHILVLNVKDQLATMLCVGANVRQLKALSAWEAAGVSLLAMPVGNGIGMLFAVLFADRFGALLSLEMKPEFRPMPFLIADILMLVFSVAAVRIPIQKIVTPYPRHMMTVQTEEKIRPVKSRITCRNACFYVAKAHVNRRRKERRRVVFFLSVSLILMMGILQQSSCFTKSAVKKESLKNYEVSASFHGFAEELSFLSDVQNQTRPYADDFSYQKSYSFSMSDQGTVYSLYLTGLCDDAFLRYADSAGLSVSASDSAIPCLLLSAQKKDNRYRDEYDTVRADISGKIRTAEIVPLYAENTEASEIRIMGASDTEYLGQNCPLWKEGSSSSLCGVIRYSDWEKLMSRYRISLDYQYVQMYFSGSDESRIADIVKELADQYGVSVQITLRENVIREMSGSALIRVFSAVAAILFVFILLAMMNMLQHHFDYYKEEYQTLAALGATPGQIRKIILRENILYAATSGAWAIGGGYALMLAVYFLNIMKISRVGFAFDPLILEVLLLLLGVFAMIVLFFSLISKGILSKRLRSGRFRA